MPDPITTWVLTTCRALALDPDAVDVTESLSPLGQYLCIEITPGAKNARRIIGTGGEIIKAMRTLAAKMTPRPVLLLVLGPEYDAAGAKVVGPGKQERGEA